MRQFIARRLGYSLLSLLLLSLTIFFFVRVTGDPAALLVEPGASEDDIAAIHQKFGLDQPLWVQYGLFMWSLVRGDFGQSFYYQTPVFDLYLDRLPNSLLLAPVAMAFSLLVGIPTGILAAVRVGPLLGQRGQAVRAARSVAAIVLRRPGADPAVLGLSGLAAVVRHRAACCTSSCRPSRSVGISPPRICA